MDAVEELLRSLGAAWDAGDGDGVAAHFTPGAEFVDVLGRLQQGRDTIAREHRALFTSIYAGSTCVFREIDRRVLVVGVTLLHSASRLTVPAGPRRGDTHATQTMLVEDGLVSAFHNTVQAPMERFTGEDEGFGDPEALGSDTNGPRDPRLGRAL